MLATLPLAATAALVVFLVAGLALGAFARRAERQRAAIASLGAMKWGEFAHHVSAMLGTRGLEADSLHHRPGEQGFDLRMRRGSAVYLVLCKLGAAFRVGPEAVRDLARTVELHGASGGILVTTGHFTPEAARQSQDGAIELIDGGQLWDQLEPLLPHSLVEEIDEAARLRLRGKRISAAVAAVAAAALAVAAGSMLGGGRGEPQAGRESATEARTPAVAVPDRPAPAPAPADPALPAAMPDPDLDEAALAARRAEAERNVNAVPGLVAATWSTRSTLAVVLPSPAEPGRLDATVVEAICTELVRFEELRYTRLQLQFENPRSEDEARVRWRQCR